MYSGTFQKMKILRRVWKTLSKFLCWKIWLSINKKIFKNEGRKHGQSAAKAITFVSVEERSELMINNI
jgi:hypothetical protein